MRKSQLIILFLGLNGTEKRAINKIVVSPFFNQRKEVIDLWRYLVESGKDGSTAFRKELVFQSVFPKKKFDDKLLKHVCSWLLKCVEEYLAFAAYKRTAVKETLHRAQAYRDKKQIKYFQKSLRIGDQQLQKMPRGVDYFYFDYRLQSEKYSFVETRSKITEDNLRLMNVALDKYLMMSKLKQACIVRSHQSIFTTKYDFQFVDLLLSFLKNNQYLEEPGIACYYFCYRALSENSEACFKDLRNSLQNNQDVLPHEDVEYLYFSAINFCIRKINTGMNQYRREVFDLYRYGLTKGLLIQDGELSRFTYNNIVSAGLAFEEFEWTEEFIQEYKSMIDLRYRESNYNYSLAKLNFTRKKYDKAMSALRKVDDHDLLLNLEAKVILLKIYFETKEFDPLASLLSSFSVMLSRKKVVGYHKEHFQNIIRFTNRILGLTPGNKKAKQKLKQDILEAKILGQREWLLEQLK